MSLKAEEEYLVAEALKGAPFAWESLVRRYEGRVYNFGLRLTGNESDALDLMQEVFIGVYKNLHRFRGESMFSTWLFRIAHNKAIDQARKNKPHLDRSLSDIDGDDALPLPLVEDDHPLERLITNQQNAKVCASLHSLSWEQRLLIELKVFQSHTFEDIAELESISINTVKTRFYGALRKLKKILESSHDM